jgi:hypothetical protein
MAGQCNGDNLHRKRNAVSIDGRVAPAKNIAPDLVADSPEKLSTVPQAVGMSSAVARGNKSGTSQSRRRSPIRPKARMPREHQILPTEIPEGALQSGGAGRAGRRVVNKCLEYCRPSFRENIRRVVE